MSKKEQRKAIKEMMDAVEGGHAFTVYGTDGPLAMVLPWEDWHALNQKLIMLEKLMREEQILAAPMMAEDHWGQGDVADDDGIITHECGSGTIKYRMPAQPATQADEDELVARYGKGSEELADEAEAGYDTAGMLSRERAAMGKYGLLKERVHRALTEPACEHCGVVGGGHTTDCIGGPR